MYTNEGRSEYKALILRLNGTLARATGHRLGDLADKKNISDDFSPVFPFGYPNDPADIDAEYGRSHADERYRLVLTGIFHLPWELRVAPIYEYGSGQPWNHRLGYDFNGDGKNSDRPAGVDRKRGRAGVPPAQPASDQGASALRRPRLDVIVEAFNVLNRSNYDVNSIDTAGVPLRSDAGQPSAAPVPNPNFGRRATLPARRSSSACGSRSRRVQI